MATTRPPSSAWFVSPRSYMPAFVVESFDFVSHFLLGFAFPLICVILLGFICAWLYLQLHRASFGRYATVDELYDEAVKLISTERNARGNGSLDYSLEEKRSNEIESKSGKRKRGNVGSWTGSGRFSGRKAAMIAAGKNRAFDNLRLCLALRPDMTRARLALATELFYGYLNSDLHDTPPEKTGGGKKDSRGESSDGGEGAVALEAVPSAEGLRRRAGAVSRARAEAGGTQRPPNKVSPALEECRKVLREGLKLNTTNNELLRLSEEVEVVSSQGRNGVHAKMMNVGSFGWAAGGTRIG